MDEAGIGDPEVELHSVVSAVIVHGDSQIKKTRTQLAQIVAHYIPAEHHPDFVFHAKDLFNGGGEVFKRQGGISLEKRLEIARELARIPADNNLHLCVGWAKRSDFLAHAPEALAKMSKKERHYGPVLLSYLLCCTHVEHWFRGSARGEHCMMIVEDNTETRAQIRDLQRAHQNPAYINGLSEAAKQLFPLKHIQGDPAFTTKRPNTPMELADFFAYVGRRLLDHPDHPVFMPFFQQMKPLLFEHQL